jgi:ornithine cyclodeaminase
MNDACIKSGAVTGGEDFVVKIATGGFSDNQKLGLPTADGIMCVFSQKTGLVDGILLDEGYLTDLRTAAAGAVAARYLAPRALKHIGVIGTGIQARFQVRLLASETTCRSVLVWGRSKTRAEETCRDIEKLGLGFTARACGSPREVAAEARLIVTTTSASAPILWHTDIHPGTHINAVGADGLGKQELDLEICALADLCVADSRQQCVEFGELSHACNASKLSPDSVVELGDLILEPGARRRGGDGDQRVTVFDSTGVGIQDVAIASMVLGALRRQAKL